ncbi:hypothetical protein Tco_1159210, partial [Tanacetum coccineum]
MGLMLTQRGPTCEASSFNNSSRKRSFGKEIIFNFEKSTVHSHEDPSSSQKQIPDFSEFSQRPHKEQNVGPDRLASARKRLQENYQEDQNAKKQRTIQVMDIHDIPKPKNNFTAKNK